MSIQFIQPFLLRKYRYLFFPVIFIVSDYKPLSAVDFCTFTMNASLFAAAGCNGATTGSVQVSASPAGQYLYLFIDQEGFPVYEGQFDTQTIINGIAPGNYTVIVTALVGIQQCQAPVSVPFASVSANTPIIVFAAECACEGSISLAITGTQGLVPPVTYEYIVEGDNGFVSTAATTDTSTVFNGLCGANYTWTVNASDSSPNGCIVSTSGIVNIGAFDAGGPTPHASITGNTNYNVNDTINLFGAPTMVLPPGPGLTYLWSGPNAFSANTQDVSFTAAANSGGTYFLKVCNPSNGVQCCDTAQITITVNNDCTLQATPSNPQPSCANAATGSVDITVSGQMSTVAYSTDGGNTYTSVNSNPFTVPNLPTGSLTILVADGCVPPCDPVSVTACIGVRSGPTVTINGVIDVCGITNPTLTANASGGAAPYNFAWSTGAQTATTSVTGAGTYCVNVTDANGCTGFNSVMINADLNAGITPAQSALCQNGSLQLTALPTPGGTNYQYAWTCCGSDTIISTESTVFANKAGTYNVQITDPRFSGCVGSAHVEVSAQQNCPDPIVSLCCKKKVSQKDQTKLRVTITNAGTSPVTHLTVTDLLPSCFNFIKGTSKDGNWTFMNDQSVVATLSGALAPGQKTTFTLCVKTCCHKTGCHDGLLNRVIVTGDGFEPKEAACAIAVH